MMIINDVWYGHIWDRSCAVLKIESASNMFLLWSDKRIYWKFVNTILHFQEGNILQ